MGISWFFLSCGRRLGIPLQLLGLTHGNSCVSSRKSSLHSRCQGKRSRGIKPQIAWKGQSQSVLELRQEIWIFSSCDRPEGASSVSGKSGKLSSWECASRVPLEWLQGTRASRRIEAGNLGSSPVLSWILGFLLRFSGESAVIQVEAQNSGSLSRCRDIRPSVDLR